MTLYHKTFLFHFLLLAFLCCVINVYAQQEYLPEAKVDSFRYKIRHIIVIYQENRSFDGLYGKFPGCNNLDSAKSILQLDKEGNKIELLPSPVRKSGPKLLSDYKFSNPLPAQPFDLSKYIRTNEKTGDLVHRFYTEQLQIDGGKMDKFVAWSDNGGLTLSYYDVSNMPMVPKQNQNT
jgi:phospholipase C